MNRKLNADKWCIVPVGKEHTVEICALWNREIGNEFPMTEPLLERNGAAHPAVPAGGAVAIADRREGTIAGVAICKGGDRGTGFISLLLVDSRFSRIGIGSSLLSHAEVVLARSGANAVALGGDPGHLMPGLPAIDPVTSEWFVRKGYTRNGETYDMHGDFRRKRFESPAMTKAQAEGAVFSVAQEGDREDLLAFLQEHFPGRWAQSAADYFAAGGTGRDYVVARDEEEIVGFCRVNDVLSPILTASRFWVPQAASDWGGIGPLGVAARHRGKGIGLALTEAGVRALLERGVTQIVIDWTTLADFYAKLGFGIWKTYQTYIREL